MIEQMQREAYELAIKRGKIILGQTEDKDIVYDLFSELAELDKAETNCSATEQYNNRIELLSETANPSMSNEEYKTYYNKNVVEKYKQIVAGTKADELADLILICLSSAEFYGIDMEAALKNKMTYNSLRNQ
jgi:hypothetical protein